ncbi:bifunctional alpha,alpha-trehalose-phosphate synthase (UDP-forming)/trehalose-phosphatase [Bdellovibrio sp. SKB1291214]|uniref:bifunctional alpha,alpha-trehalose-phosphate synthase (UDP-forming)/trehalose-phosphatase n=1 Tax=Bdellovibrio sp. SKB1291214 TaxID=1732569 RepID=UPI00223FC10F|nr:bifunctional alpha,alpha-trehalose-phosphate synthase (UDP-forming)/trehalose-phosphatase [Bdellovibrio sp. SKB1291214]UYL09630.1 bifunctional alpha,alpha-trehalose-phosphate synthase (UDP-forming)/trehalose-phosphatase [Bdellovibrio sp. SKB1291214]
MNPKTEKLTRGSGGLVSALLGVSLKEPFYWFGFETDKKNGQILKERSGEIKDNLRCHPVMLSKEIYDTYYDGVANDLIWPLFHYETQLANFNRENWDVYRQANQTMADEILAIANDNDTIWIHDFHFLLLPKMIKEKNPKLKVGFFLHIPFPSNEIFRQLPVREEILQALIACDLLGFHEHSYLRHFNVTLKAFLGIDSTMFKAEIGDHVLNLGVYPISIDTEEYQQKAASPEVEKQCAVYRQRSFDRFQLLGIDRLDYTKGLELKLLGFQRALKKYPEMVGKVTLLQVAVPTRQKVPLYAKIKRDLDRIVGAINGEFATPDYVPVQYIYNSIDETTLLALYRRSDAALVTSKRDGMNLVAMEYVMAQDINNPGVLVLSEFAGAASLLPDALIINPWDQDALADSIYRSFRMSPVEKEHRLRFLQETLLKYSATKWAESFLGDLENTKEDKTHCALLPHNPKAWPKAMLESLQQKRIRLILDYDGTLVPLTKRPEDAVLSSEMRNLIARLNEEVEVIIISGRPRVFLDEQFADIPITLVAEHGAFYRLAGQKWQSRLSLDVDAWYGEAEQMMNAYCDRVPFSWIEKKEACLVWHYRQSPASFAEYQAKKLDEELQVGLGNEPVSVMMGSKIVEAKAVECNKGSFLRWLMQSSYQDNSYYICLGDDRTDEDMFRVVDGKGTNIKIGTAMTVAPLRLDTQEQVPEFLSEVSRLLSEPNEYARSANA